MRNNNENRVKNSLSFIKNDFGSNILRNKKRGLFNIVETYVLLRFLSSKTISTVLLKGCCTDKIQTNTMVTNYKWIFHCKLLILKVQWSFQGFRNAAHDFKLECKFLSGLNFLSSLKNFIYKNHLWEFTVCEISDTILYWMQWIF